MTVQELIDILKDFPADAVIKTPCGIILYEEDVNFFEEDNEVTIS